MKIYPCEGKTEVQQPEVGLIYDQIKDAEGVYKCNAHVASTIRFLVLPPTYEGGDRTFLYVSAEKMEPAANYWKSTSYKYTKTHEKLCLSFVK